MTAQHGSEHDDTRGSAASANANPEEWAIIGAVHGRGTILVGRLSPDPMEPVVVIAPPEVRLATPSSWPAPLCTEGWRIATWQSRSDDGEILIDQARPLDVVGVSIEDVLTTVLVRCPQHLSWVADCLERDLSALHAMLRPDPRGSDLAWEDKARRDLEDLVEDGEAALAALAARLARAGEPRLRPGWLHDRDAFFRNMHDAATSTPRDGATVTPTAARR